MLHVWPRTNDISSLHQTKKIEQVENYNSADRQTKEQNSLTAANHKLTHNLLQRVAHITSDEQ